MTLFSAPRITGAPAALMVPDDPPMRGTSKPSTRPVVLHVTECYDGGVRSVMDYIARSVQDAEHHLLYTGGPGPGVRAGYASAHRYVGGVAGARRALAVAVRKLRPTVVHAHSSWAGVAVRTTAGLGVPVVYQPHCYAFEDGARPAWFQLFTRLVERALARRTTAVVAVSEREYELSRREVGHRDVVLVPNAPSVRATATGGTARGVLRDPHVVMLGRICPQKDPLHFALLARRTRAVLPGARFTWIGDGEPRLRQALVAAGIDVTGWRGPEEIAALLDDAHVYVHSARYEGFPVAVLDAASRGLPVLVRPIGAFDGTDLVRMPGPHEFPAVLQRICEDEAFRVEVRQRAQEVLAAMDADNGTRRLEALYGRVQLAPRPRGGRP